MRPSTLSLTREFFPLTRDIGRGGEDEAEPGWDGGGGGRVVKHSLGQDWTGQDRTPHGKMEVCGTKGMTGADAAFPRRPGRQRQHLLKHTAKPSAVNSTS